MLYMHMHMLYMLYMYMLYMWPLLKLTRYTQA